MSEQDYNNPRVYDASRDIGREVEQARSAGLDQPDMGAVQASAAVAAQVVADAALSGKRVFIAPGHKNQRFLIKGGRQAVVVQGSTEPFIAGMQGVPTEVGRIGDVWLTFTGGIVIVDPDTEEGELQLAWAEGHRDICRDAVRDPEVEVWASLKEGQLNKTDREPSIPRNLDIDRVLAGDFSGFGETGSIAVQARALLAAQSV